MRKIKYLIIILLPLLLLSSCKNESDLSESDTNCIRLFFNEYDSYENMIVDERKLDLHHDDDLFLLNIDFSSISIQETRYYIGGTDYCILDKNMKSYKYHDKSHCECLHNREAFITYKINDDESFVIIYREKINNNNILEWKKEHLNGSERSYEGVYGYEGYRYNLKNTDNENIIFVSFKNTDEEFINKILNIVQDQVEQYLSNN